MARSAHRALVGKPAEPKPIFRGTTKAQSTMLLAFSLYLQDYRDEYNAPLSPNTRNIYLNAVSRAMRLAKTTKAELLLKWSNVFIHERTPHGTANPIVYGLRHYVQSCVDGSDEEARARLLDWKKYPFMRRLPKGYRDALAPEELVLYQKGVDESDLPDFARSMLLLLPGTGLRIREACELRRSDVQKRKGRHGLRVLGKGSKVRWVPLSAFKGEAMKVLEDYDPKLLHSRTKTDEPVFPSPHHPMRHLSTSTIEGHLFRLRNKLWQNDESGDLSKVTPHVLRHTFATRLIRANIPLALVQRALGHASITQTARYVHMTDADLGDFFDRIGDGPLRSGDYD